MTVALEGSRPSDAAFCRAGEEEHEHGGPDADGRAFDPSLFPRLVLGWINADFRAQIRIFQHFSSSTRKSSSRKQLCKILQKKKKKFLQKF